MKNFARCIAGLVAMLGFTAHGISLAEPARTAVFGLYAASGSSNLELDGAAVSKLGCEVLRVGRIVGADGPLSFETQPSAFVALSCPRPIIGKMGVGIEAGGSTNLLDGLIRGAKRLTLFEGPLAAMPASSTTGVSDRQYIVKVSANNNVDPAGRDRDLAAIDAIVSKRKDRYYPEAAIQVNRSIGAPRPDEVAIIYYDSAEAGERFRAGNPDVMTQIGQFNGRHVREFVYLVGRAAL